MFLTLNGHAQIAKIGVTMVGEEGILSDRENNLRAGGRRRGWERGQEGGRGWGMRWKSVSRRSLWRPVVFLPLPPSLPPSLLPSLPPSPYLLKLGLFGDTRGVDERDSIVVEAKKLMDHGLRKEGGREGGREGGKRGR
jgi:hypothetical protein